jgi:opacity protein-like surface antigen
MKKFLFTITSLVLIGLCANAQTEPKKDEFDKKHRLGIRAALQPCWYKSDNASSKGNGSVLGFGFGLAWEIKLSDIIRFSTGIGGDFEGGKISYRNDTTFRVKAVLNNEGEYEEAKNGIAATDYNLKNGNTYYELKERRFRTTMITIPLTLKMMTSEYSGFRYFGVFGGELGIRAGIKVDDTYYNGVLANNTGTTITTSKVTDGELKKEGILLGKDATLLPFRVGMNLGLGTEYRIAGSTSLVFSVNYFQSFTNLMRKESKILSKEQHLDTGNQTWNLLALNQQYLMRAVRINIGIMF